MTKEQLLRKKQVENAVANQRLEGLKVSKDSKKIADNYVVGKINAKQASKQILDRYGVK